MDFSEARFSGLIKYDKLFTMEKNLIEIVRRGVCVCGCVLERSFDLAWTPSCIFLFNRAIVVNGI